MIRVPTPCFLYGTAWKEDDTQRLVEMALRAGFRAIDTANQRRHYHEAAVGDAVRAAIAQGVVERKDLFLQTKFTFARGQDHRLPYDPAASIATQIEQSFASSLDHLGTDVIDSYLLHAPMTRNGLVDDDWNAWRTMEAIHDRGRATAIGVSNFSREQLEELVRGARIKPRFVQNRCYASAGWDRRVREFCSANGIVYQCFSLLTANQDALARPEVAAIAQRHGRSVTQIAFRFALDVGTWPITGTTNEAHARADLDVFAFRLEPGEIAQIDSLVG